MSFDTAARALVGTLSRPPSFLSDGFSLSIPADGSSCRLEEDEPLSGHYRLAVHQHARAFQDALRALPFASDLKAEVIAQISPGDALHSEIGIYFLDEEAYWISDFCEDPAEYLCEVGRRLTAIATHLGEAGPRQPYCVVCEVGGRLDIPAPGPQHAAFLYAAIMGYHIGLDTALSRIEEVCLRCDRATWAPVGLPG